jgi:hypothetical protein
MVSSHTLGSHRDGPPGWVYALIALVGMLVGLALGQVGFHSTGGSRIPWPEPRPRSLNP